MSEAELEMPADMCCSPHYHAALSLCFSWLVLSICAITASTDFKFAWLAYMQIDNYSMFRAHYNSIPATGFPPIPSVPVTLPVDKHTLHVLCFKARYERHTSTHVLEEEDIQGTIAALLEAARLLDQDQDVREFQRAQQTRSGTAARTYILKRNGSYGAMRQAKFSLTKRQHLEAASPGDTDVCSAVFDDGQQSETCGR